MIREILSLGLIPYLLSLGLIVFFWGAVSQPGPIALACVVGEIGLAAALYGWLADYFYGVQP